MSRFGIGTGTLALTSGVALALAVNKALRQALAEDLTGQVVIVTGSSRGLGLALAREFARQGAKVVLCARDAEQLEWARADIEKRGAEALAVECDVTNPDDVARLVTTATARFGRVDVLVNNAGTIQVGPSDMQTRADFEDALNEMFWSVYNCTTAVLPQMRARHSGRIVNITSIGGKISVPHLLPYSTAKFAATGFSEGLRAELAKDGITVVTVIPGLMRTGSPVNAIFKGQNEKEYTWFALSDNIPGVSINAERAARQIVAAARRGEAEAIISLPAQAAVLFHGVFPGLTIDIAALVNRLLPAPGGIGKGRATGRESQTHITESPLLTLGKRAGERFHQEPAAKAWDGDEVDDARADGSRARPGR